MLPSFGLVYSLYIATIATPVNKKKQKKQKKIRRGVALPPGKRTNNCSGLGPGQKNGSTGETYQKPVLPAGQWHLLTSSPSSCSPNGAARSNLFWLLHPSRCDSRNHSQREDHNDACVDEE
jgi:hypothetical protein